MNYYNENDPKAAKWIRNLVSAGLIPPGDVDDRSIADVRPSDLASYTQCHFFAGIGGWPEALRLAGIPATTRLWTGSCPCQPFSAAGKRKGTADERHLWPVFRDLIAQCRPPVVFGEQVASADGRNWLSTVRAEMEALAYAVGAADLCAAGVGAPHPRQRLYFVGLADADRKRHDGIDLLLWENAFGRNQAEITETSRSGEVGRLADTDHKRLERAERERLQNDITGCSDAGKPDSMADTGRTSPPDSFWAAADWLFCRDGKWRPVEPGTFPLAHGIPGRVAHLRGYGNAIVPQVAATFIRAALAEIKTD